MQPYVLVLAQTSHEGARYVRRAKLPRGRWRVVAKASSIRGIRRAEVHCLPGFHRRPDKHAILGVLRYAECTWKDVEMPPSTPRELQVGPFTVAKDGTISITDAEREQVREGAEAEIAEAIEDAVRDKAATLTEDDKAELAAIVPLEIDPVVADELAAIVPFETDSISDSRRRFPTTRQVEAAYRYNGLRDSGTSNGDNMVAEGAPDAPRPKRRRRCADCGELHFKDEPCVRTDGVNEETPVVAKSATMFDF